MLDKFVDRKLRSNAFSETLDMRGYIGEQLQVIDLENNDIASVMLGNKFTSILMYVHLVPFSEHLSIKVLGFHH